MMLPKDFTPIIDCRNVNELIGQNYGWNVLKDNHNIYTCEASEGTQPIPNIKFTGPGISHIKNNQYNNAKNGLIYISNSNFECTMTEINAAGVASHPASLIRFSGIGSHTFRGTKFLYCGVFPWDQVHDNNNPLILNKTNWDPALIFIEGESTNIFNAVQFKIFKEDNPQGWELVPTRSIKNQGGSLNITNSEFFNSTAETKGAFIWTGTKKDVFISKCEFEECFAKENNGHAIYISDESESVIIEFCKFLDCGKFGRGYAIVAEVSGLVFFNNSVIFSDSTNSSGCVRCISKGKYTLENNYFTNAKETTDKYHGVAIDYQGYDSNAKDENIVLNGNTFDYIHGINEGRCFSAQVKEGKLTVLERNYVQNCPIGNFFIKIMERTPVQEFLLKNWKFINNTLGFLENEIDHLYGGGAGIWIENDIIADKYVPLNLTIQECEFKDNYCEEKGGAFQIGSLGDVHHDKYVTLVEVKIFGCNFENNTAGQEGGALSIQTNYPLEISNCNFTNNKSPKNAGAIYIKTVVNDPTGNGAQMPSASITSCTFRGNSGKEAHCIYIVDAPKTTIDISLCNFDNNYDKNYQSGSCILSNSFQLTVRTCEFINDDLEHGSGGINVTSTCILDISDCDFKHCTAGNIEKSYGGGIGYANIAGTEREESIKINDCNFEGNGGANGVAIGLKPVNDYPEISNIEIKNHVLTSWIFFIFFQFETDGDFELNQVHFTGNSFDSSRYSEVGGGTGIWIAESEDINYYNAFNLVFNTCTFSNNYSPENGGAFSYGGSQRLESIGVTFNNCIFEHNLCEHYFGGAIRFETRKPATLIKCTFKNNTALKQSETGGSGGGAVFIGSVVESVLISDCTFDDCFAHRGSFIFTNGALKDINISKCTFQNLREQTSSVYIEVDSQITRFAFDSNTFKDIHCDGNDGGAGLHIFNGADCTISNCIFENCEATPSNSGVIRISEDVDTSSLLIFTLCEFNNEKGSRDDSARPIYIASSHSLVQFNSCNFLHYDQDTQRDGTILYSKSISSTVFYNCSFSSLKGKCLMHMESAKFVDILDCQFTDCEVDQSLIFADEAINFTVSNNIFSNDNDPIRFGNKVLNGLVSNNTFEECSTNKNDGGGALFINGGGLTIEIRDNNFTKCTAREGLAIFFDQGVLDAEIHDCKFENNYKENSNAYTIYTKSSALNFHDCTIIYTDNYQGCGINIAAPCAADISNVQFRNLGRPSAIKYNLGTGATTDKQTVITNCLFTGFSPKGSTSSEIQYSTFNFGPNLNIQFYNNTIENQISNGWSNLLIGLIDKEIENCSFINNEVIGSIAGGAGLDISGSEVKVISCNFRENHAFYQGGIGGSGGAFQFGKTANLEIDTCTFINNRADLEGGAISITCTSSYIHDSRFENNYAAQQNFGNATINDKMGGAIYLNNPSGSQNNKYILSNCFISKNTGSSNGHALCVEGSNTYAYICDLCLFEDNSRNNGGSQIFIDKNAHLDFSNSTVCLNNFTTKSRGIELLNGELNAHDTTFTNIEASLENNAIEGNAILVDRGENVANIEDNLFKDCYISKRYSYSVTFNGKELNFFRNTFNFSSNKGCGCLRIYTTGNINIENNIFQNAYVIRDNGNDPSFHGVFIYEEKDRITKDRHTVIKLNTFQNCSCYQTACFQFKWTSNDYEFIDNTFQNNDLPNYLGEFDFMGKKINGEFYCGRNKFINNTARSLYGGGAGLWFQNKEKEILLENHFTVILDGCQFIGNHAVDSTSDSRGYKNGNGGAIQFGWTESVSNIDVEVRNSTFINNVADRQGGALSIEIVGYTIIDNCTFDGNKAGNKEVDQGQVLGGAVHAWLDFPWGAGHHTTLNNNSWLYSENITITNTKFIHNEAKDGKAIYIQSSSHTNFYVIDTIFSENYNSVRSNFSIVSDAKEFVFERSKIEFANRTYASSGIRTSSLTKITDSHFYKTCAFNSDIAEALLAESETNGIEISNTIFEECGQGGNGYIALKINTPEVNIHNNIFNYSSNDADRSCLPVLIKKYSDVSFIENKITNSRCDGAFKYEPTNGNKNNEKVIVRLCTFEKVQGQNSRALFIRLITPNITFSNNTIQDCVSLSNTAGYLFVFYIQNSGITEFVVDNIIFRNLNTDSLYGGGCGCWVQHNVKYTLTFRDCTFENNYAKYSKSQGGYQNGKGGALQYGFSATISNVDLKFEGCEFNKNVADEEGGALCLMIQGNIDIFECKFINNQAGLNEANQYNGGAISIIPEYNLENHLVTESIIIDGCTFTGNDAPDATAIYVNRAPQTDLIITNNCRFLDNTNETSNHATVMAETRKLEVDDSIFDFTSLTKTCNAITTNATTVVLDNTQFYRCMINQNQGSALLLKTGIKSCNINNCHFIDNGNGNMGSVVYTEASSFEFSNSEIGFTSLSTSDRGIYVPFICKFYLYNSYLHHCQINDNNGASIYYPGTRRTAHTEDISLENVHFYNNSCNYASVFYMRPTTVPKLKNLTIQDHQRGNFGIVIIFQAKVNDDILVEKCNFINNYRGQSSEYLPDCGGSGLWIACANQSTGYLEAYRLIFSQCTFKENKNNYCGGAFAYGYSPTLRYIFLDFNECIFENNTCDGQMGGALAFNGQVPVTLTKSIFRGNKCNSEIYKGHCIYIHQRCKATINDCTFVDNGIFGHDENNKDAHGHSIIQCSGTRLDMNRCNMTFTDPTIINSRCIDIDYHSIVNLVNSTFSNVNVGTLWGGALYLNKTEKSIVDEQITIDSCIFENNNAANGCSALFWATSAPTLINLSFVNQPESKYIFCIFFKEFRDTCTVENTFFENCTSASTDGGGSSIWIANNEDISHGRPFDLIFHNCTWRNNEANTKGGAIHYGTSRTLVGVQMTFDKCHFLNNHAKEEGGAVSLVTKSPIVFSDCTFKNNYVKSGEARASIAGTKGGSISINSKTPLVQVSGCSFTNETADDGNAIFIYNNVQACLISGCTFNNCGKKGTTIVSETIELMLLNSEISFSRRDQSCRALEIRTISVTTISQCTFHNCYTTEKGAGIYLNNTLESEEQEDFTLEDSIFDACQAEADGCALFLNVNSAPVLRAVTFQNHRFDKNISVILNNNDFQDLFSIQSCKFINNQFQNTLIQDGGGCAMFIANTQVSLESLYKLSFEDCTWSKNSAAYGGAFSYGTKALIKNIEHVFERCIFDSNIASNDKGGALYLYTTQLILFDGCTFSNNRCHNPESQNQKQGGAIYILKCSSVSITGTTFIDNYATDGHAIYIEDLPSANIFGCTFDSNNEGREGSQIASKCAELIIYDSTIKFDTKKVPARGIQILKQCSSTFANCKFLNCKITNEGGAIHISEDTTTNRTESLTIDGCLFDNCDSSNGAVINAWVSCNPTIRGSTISNCNQGHYAFCIFFVSVPTVPRFVSIDDCTFEGNKFNGASTSDAGGIGLWIAYRQELSVETLSLTFNRCDFISNLCGKNGGAFAYGESTTLKNITLTFDTCTFNNNTCNEGKGGALYLSTGKPITITNCHFINNKCNGANTRGSAIYINSPSEKVQISESTFEGGQSIDGAAIYSESQTNNLIISNSRFNNCASSSAGSVIYSTAKVFNLQDSNITFDLGASIKCCGVCLQNKASAIFSNIQLINCQTSETGGGLKIDFQNGNNDESLVIKDITIQNAVAKNGCAMMINTNKSPTLEGINIRNCTSGNYVMVIFFTTYVNEAKLSHCIFQYNQFANNGFPANPDGGGSGIWVANSGLRDDDKNKHLQFDDCHWIGNSVKESSSLKYGGAFALGTSLTTRQTELTFNSCRFIHNSASERGGSLYLCTSLPVKISRCLFDGNEAANGAGIYLETTSNVTIEYSQIVRSKATQNGAAFIKSSQHLQMLNVTFTENNGPVATSLYLENEGIANIEKCSFDFSRSQNQYQIRLHGDSSSASITFRNGCFIHSGDHNGNTHIYSTHKGTINLPEGNCFDTPQNIAINNQGGSINAESGIFDCDKCGSIYVPTIAPHPTASLPIDASITAEIPTQIPTTSTSSGQSGTSSNKKKTKTIAMIAGIAAAAIVVIIVIIILIWLFVCRKRSAADNNSDNNASEMNDEQITEISGIDPGADDPIWAGTNQDNPLFNGGDDQDEDQMIHNDFEESWGDSVI